MNKPIWIWEHTTFPIDAVPFVMPLSAWQVAANSEIMYTKRS